MYKIQVCLLGCLLSLACSAKDTIVYSSPFDFPLLLSANFGELRTNHFHNGLDIKTKGSVGHPVRCIADGYVARVAVQHGGYGQAIYIAHPNGQTSVYGHVLRFAPKVERFVRNYQYANETFVCNLYPKPAMFPVKKGDIIAWSGNEGASAGPHLHLELRKTATDEYLNPMPYFKKYLSDTKAPVATHLAVYPVLGQGVVEGSYRKKMIPVASVSLIHAWGKIYAGISAKDLMNNTHNVYGVHSVTLYVDDKKVFHSVTDAVLPDENRMINSFVDFDERVRTRRWIMRSYKEPGNRLRLLKVGPERGIVTVSEERDYHFRYVLEDDFGNRRTYRFTVRGKKQSLPALPPFEGEWLRVSRNTIVQRPGLELMVPKGYVYTDVPLDVHVIPDSVGVSYKYVLDAGNTPLHSYCPLAIGVRNMPVSNPKKYYLKQQDGKWSGPVIGKLEKGWYRAKVRALGTFSVAVDTVPPVITPVERTKWKATRNIRMKVKDEASGIAAYKVFVDGKFVLFGLKKGVLVIQDKEKIKRGVPHVVKVIVTDCCGNETRKQFKI